MRHTAALRSVSFGKARQLPWRAAPKCTPMHGHGCQMAVRQAALSTTRSRMNALEDLERKLAVASAAYMATTDETERREVARHLCAVLEFVSDARLKGEDAWSPYAWVDGVLDDSIALISRHAVIVRGKLIWVDDRNQ